MSRDALTDELHSIAKRLVLRQVRDVKRNEGRKRAVNFARNLAADVLKAAGLPVQDDSSVHEDHVRISLTYDDGLTQP